jgi:hypothetical protein
MGNPPHRQWSTRHYFVDEAGDATLFDRKGRIIIGSEGCSRFFILGLLDVPNYKALALDLDDLRKRLISDPYFSGVPSMQEPARKTAQSFHAKKEHRFLRLLWQAFNLVRDLDETSQHRYGEYYTQKKPLTLAALNREPGI